MIYANDKSSILSFKNIEVVERRIAKYIARYVDVVNESKQALSNEELQVYYFVSGFSHP